MRYAVCGYAVMRFCVSYARMPNTNLDFAIRIWVGFIGY
jgi:prolipoprotein diacylglyceryltransferase